MQIFNENDHGFFRDNGYVILKDAVPQQNLDTLIEVIFDYMGTPVSGSSARWAVVQREASRCIIRDRQFEGQCWEKLRQAGFRRRLGDMKSQVNVEIARRDLGRAVRELVDNSWAVFADGSKVRQAGGLRFRVSSDVDWFDVHTDVDFEGRSVSFPELLRALERGDSTVRLDDGSLGILPEEWLEQIGMISGLGTATEDGLRFSTSQAALLDALLDRTGGTALMAKRPARTLRSEGNFIVLA